MTVLPAPVTTLTDSDNDGTEGAAKAKAQSKGKAKAKGLVPTSKSKVLRRPAASCEESTEAPSTADEKAEDPAPKAKTKAKGAMKRPAASFEASEAAAKKAKVQVFCYRKLNTWAIKIDGKQVMSVGAKNFQFEKAKEIADICHDHLNRGDDVKTVKDMAAQLMTTARESLAGSEAVPGPATGVASDAGGAAAAAAKSEPAERVESEEVAATEEPNVDDSHDQQEGGEEEKKENDPSLDVD
ncbi:unnamed protein product [Cladocopium goreaui]|uniref:Uncharacterized protein n=1 Tax=Cladocopium goreaui TaxID=2562237 RepID=A0A9P1G1K2_9DINO|nr:unnamed protein product [Cladocopium goreaui]